eukprot:TRINITY_DN23382_c0_g1_i1.p1 TRINITY_DN23382_c0_g1~~TRINITY_DN23382_c0_g1_i1.p1  ORF type:complete len:172 (+),score=40.69 TRINITY_DN23382_c0_g1_i1:30-545(+)
MPRGLGRFIYTAFEAAAQAGPPSHGADETSTDHGSIAATASGGSKGRGWEKLTSDKLFGELHPKIQDFLVKVPGLKKEWEEAMGRELEDVKHKDADEIKEISALVRGNIKALNKEVEDNPDALKETQEDLFGASARQAKAECSAWLLPPSALSRRSKAGRQRWRRQQASFL